MLMQESDLMPRKLADPSGNNETNGGRHIDCRNSFGFMDSAICIDGAAENVQEKEVFWEDNLVVGVASAPVCTTPTSRRSRQNAELGMVKRRLKMFEAMCRRQIPVIQSPRTSALQEPSVFCMSPRERPSCSDSFLQKSRKSKESPTMVCFVPEKLLWKNDPRRRGTNSATLSDSETSTKGDPNDVENDETDVAEATTESSDDEQLISSEDLETRVHARVRPNWSSRESGVHTIEYACGLGVNKSNQRNMSERMRATEEEVRDIPKMGNASPISPRIFDISTECGDENVESKLYQYCVGLSRSSALRDMVTRFTSPAFSMQGKKERLKIAAISAAQGSAMLGAAGGVTGGMFGTAVGAVLGLPAAMFTFGLSVPVGAMVGGATGVCAGTLAGAGAGLGGAIGYELNRK